MSKITPTLLNDTLNLVALARETALARGRQAQADRLAPVVDGLRSLAAASTNSLTPRPPVTASGALAGEDFRALLAAAQAAPLNGAPSASPLHSLTRGHVAAAMAAGGMTEIEIARQLGVAREEVRIMIRLSQPHSLTPGPEAVA
ncbi:MAG: hypothetical protein HY260_13180 [Chloroflexi bacterium]|nr:hypothetical protein [Chloroflexota bacterium]